MSTQAYQAPDPESSSPRHDQDLEPIAADAAEQVGKSPSPSTEAQKAARNDDPDDPRADAEGHVRAGQAPTEVPDSNEAETDLDDALDDSFPASDPVSSTSTPKKQ